MLITTFSRVCQVMAFRFTAYDGHEKAPKIDFGHGIIRDPGPIVPYTGMSWTGFAIDESPPAVLKWMENRTTSPQ